MPLTATCWVELVALRVLLVTVTLALRLPADCGVNFTETSQTVPAVKDVVDVQGSESLELLREVSGVSGIGGEHQRLIAQVGYRRHFRTIGARRADAGVQRPGQRADIHLYDAIVGPVGNEEISRRIDGDSEGASQRESGVFRADATPVLVICTMRLFPESTMYTFPMASTATPWQLLKAGVTPVIASSDTAPPADILTTLALVRSAK